MGITGRGQSGVGVRGEPETPWPNPTTGFAGNNPRRNTDDQWSAASSNQRIRRARAWLAQTAGPFRPAVSDVVLRYGGMSLIVSASQRCSTVVTADSRMVMDAALRLMWVGRQGRRRESRDLSVKQWGGLHRFEGHCHSRAGSRENNQSGTSIFCRGLERRFSASVCLILISQAG
jgi:hypothetical protein